MFALKMPSGLCDNLPVWAKKSVAAFVIAGLMGMFIAMSITPDQNQIFEDYEGAIESGALNRADICWVLASAAIVFLMTPGIAFFYGGMISTKNVVATIAACIIPMAVIPIMWAAIGFSLSFGKSAGYPDFIGTVTSYGLMYNMGAAPFPALAITTTTLWMFQCVFAMITPAILVGSIADRVNFPSLLLFIPLWHLGVYCPAAHMVWGGGRIYQYGVIDFAGGIVIHMSSGWGALAAAFFLGKRKATGDGPANLPYVVMGAAFLWFGWFGFNGGSALGANWQASHAFVTTNMAAAFSMFTWMIMDQLLGKSFRVTGMAMGIVVGLVGITPAAGFVNYGAAAIIGIVTAIASQLATAGMQKWGVIVVDDTLSVFACHGVGGTVGMLMTSVFQAELYGAWGPEYNGAWYGQGKELGKCLVVLFCIAGYFLVSTYIVMFITNLFISMRVTEEEEEEGLDFSKHYEGPVAESTEIPTFGNKVMPAEAY